MTVANIGIQNQYFGTTRKVRSFISDETKPPDF